MKPYFMLASSIAHLASIAYNTFDPESFMNSEVTGAMETKFTPVPIGEHGPAFIDEVEAAKLGEAPGLKIRWKIMDDALKTQMNVKDALVQQTIFLDFESNGALAFGTNKNVQLGALREALGQNGPEAWTPRMLKGQGPCMLKIGHRMGKDGSGPFAQVERVMRMPA